MFCLEYYEKWILFLSPSEHFPNTQELKPKKSVDSIPL